MRSELCSVTGPIVCKLQAGFGRAWTKMGCAELFLIFFNNKDNC